MAEYSSVFQNLRQLSSELEENLNHLENEVSDATKLLFNSETKLKLNSQGIKILQDNLEQHNSINEQCEKLLLGEEEDLKILNLEVETCREIINGHIEEQKQLKQSLLEKNLILPEHSSINESEDAEPIMISTPQDSIFVIPPPKIQYNKTYSPELLNNDCQNTILEY